MSEPVQNPVPPNSAQTVPATAAAFHQRGRLLQQRGDPRQALAAYTQAIALDPSFWPAYFERGNLKLDAGDATAALKDLEKAAQLAPRQANIWLILGNAWSATGQQDRALECFRQAITLDPAYAQAHYNSGVIQYHQGELESAVESYTAAITHKPDFTLAHANLGIALEAQGDTESALERYDAAIATDPNDPSAYWNKALLLLRNGQYPEGWTLYEWRWAAGKAGALRQYPGRPLWLGGSSIKGKTILLHAEQGLGDTIQLMRYVPMLKAAGAQVVLEVFTPLKTLFESMPGLKQVVGVGEPLPAFDLHCPLMSLPLAFGTTLESIPNDMPYVRPDPDRVIACNDRLGESDRLRVGLVWQGNPKHPGDSARSIPLAAVKGMLLDGVEFLCLQKDASPAEIEALNAFSSVKMLGSELADFSDTAAVIECCDVIISVDTAVAHLAGAMGKPTWVLLPGRADWRWLKDRTDSPWYPTARLFRQARHGIWQDVMDSVREALAERAGLEKP